MSKRIAFISEHASPLATLGGVDAGGQNVYVAETAKQLAKMGFSIDIFTRWENPEDDRVDYWKPGIRVIHVRAGSVAAIPKESLLQHMPQFRDDMLDFILSEGRSYLLIHAHFFMSALVAAEIKKILNIPFIVTFHALGMVRRIYQSADSFPQERIDIEKTIVQEADGIVAECPQDKEDLVRYYNADEKKMVVVPCGFNPAEFFPVNKTFARAMLSLPSNKKILLQLGRMVPRKGVDNVIRAMALLEDEQDCVLVVVGGLHDPAGYETDPEIIRLKKIASSAGIGDKIIFAGGQTRGLLKYYYSAADIFISTPWYEPFGITPLEAMACGTPVIGSDVGGIKFSVSDNETGYLVPAECPEAVAQKITEMFINPRLLDQMSKKAVDRVNSLFTWKCVCEELKKVYDRFSVGTVSTIRSTVVKNAV